MPAGCNEDGTWGNLNGGWVCPSANCYCSDGTTWDDADASACVIDGETQCTAGSQCPPCDFPEVAYCVCAGDTSVTPDENGCGCVNRTYVFPCGDLQCESTPDCLTQNCADSGRVKCENGVGDGCEVVETCVGACTGCDNKYTMTLECRPPVCYETCSLTNDICPSGQECRNMGGEYPICVNPACPNDSDCTCGVITTNVCGDATTGQTAPNPAVTITSPSSGQQYSAAQLQANGLTTTGTFYDKDGYSTTNYLIAWDDVMLTTACTFSGTGPLYNWRCTSTFTTGVTYDFSTGSHELRAQFYDSLGVTDNTKCAAERPLSIVVQDQPQWTIDKSSTVTCVGEGENAVARVNYTISVRYVGTESAPTGSLNSVVDDPNNILIGWLVVGSIDPATGDVAVTDPTYLGNITWSSSNTDLTFDDGETKYFRYALDIPYGYFGTFTNTARAVITGGSTIQVDESTYVTCAPGGGLPETALFDSAAAKVGLGIILVVLSFIYFKFDGVEKTINTSYKFFGGLVSKDEKLENTRSRFERKVTKRR